MALNFTPYANGADHAHGLDTSVGYVVRRTFPGDHERVHEDAGTFLDAQLVGAYGFALERAAQVRAEGAGVYAVIDTLYACGCRGQG